MAERTELREREHNTHFCSQTSCVFRVANGGKNQISSALLHVWWGYSIGKEWWV